MKTEIPRKSRNPSASAEFWPVDMRKSRSQLAAQIGLMNFRLSELIRQNAALRRKLERVKAARVAAPVPNGNKELPAKSPG